ncbi:hypothetical protein Nepgr_009186 [Nepenthes gracilis]|uniref:Aluminum-activated malate transporter n=1 Tax=Nepenthes gracilis TaxID=150966 RepID=A0AAD3SAH5_NEPGR|nr:hypothetical protein Nepgr_009186 [Nepenthes gracilis]
MAHGQASNLDLRQTINTVKTSLAGVLGVCVFHFASLCGNIGEPLLMGFSVCLHESTFMRVFPNIMARYDYRFVIFMLTFCFISITGFRMDEVLELARRRLSTIAVGVFVGLLISMFVFPDWAGEDLHNLIALNHEKLGNFLEGFGAAYFKIRDGISKEDESSLLGYRSVLNSKSMEETLANFARWEPAHRRFRFSHPWKQCLKVGALARQCAYRIDVLNAYLVPDFQVWKLFPTLLFSQFKPEYAPNSSKSDVRMSSNLQKYKRR